MEEVRSSSLRWAMARKMMSLEQYFVEEKWHLYLHILSS